MIDMNRQKPTCKVCGAELMGFDDPAETIWRADRGELRGYCRSHYWQLLPLQEQQALADIARGTLQESN
jgi:hypothetical protein